MFLSWEYELWEGYTWGTGKVNASIRYSNPVPDFIKAFAGASQNNIVPGESQPFLLFMSSLQTNVKKDNITKTISPSTNDEDFLFIPGENATPGNNTENKGYNYWYYKDKIQVNTTEDTELELTDDDLSLGVKCPNKTAVSLSLKTDSVDVGLENKGNYALSLTEPTNNNDLIECNIEGSGANNVSAQKTKDGIKVTSDSLKKIRVTYNIIDGKTGQEEKIAQKDISSNEKTININENKGNIIVSDVSEKVIIPVKTIKISGISKKIAAGKKIQLTATVLPANATNKGLVWSSSNTKVATVDQAGKVSVKKKTGGKSVTITATAKDGSGVKGIWTIKSMKGVIKKVKIVGATPVKAGKNLKLKAMVLMTPGAYKKVKWISGNTKYATVTQKGVVKTKKAGKGKKVKITAMAIDGSGKKKSVKIKIK